MAGLKVTAKKDILIKLFWVNTPSSFHIVVDVWIKAFLLTDEILSVHIHLEWHIEDVSCAIRDTSAEAGRSKTLFWRWTYATNPHLSTHFFQVVTNLTLAAAHQIFLELKTKPETQVPKQAPETRSPFFLGDEYPLSRSSPLFFPPMLLRQIDDFSRDVPCFHPYEAGTGSSALPAARSFWKALSGSNLP